MKISLKYFSRTTASVRTCTGRLLSCNYLLNDITSAVVLLIISHSEMMEMCKEMHEGLWKHSHFVSSSLVSVWSWDQSPVHTEGRL